MSTTTSRLGLLKPDGSENVDVQTQLNDNYDAIDLAVGFQVVTSSTRPANPYPGKGIAESDTSYRSYFHNGTTPVSAGWVEIPNASGTFGADLKLASANKLVIGSDVNLYRSSANVLKTDDTFEAANFPSGAWSTWTPTWTTSTGNNTPSYGNATIDTQYVKIGRLVIANFSITFGSSTNFGGGTTADNWRFTVPVTAASAFECVGFAELHQSVTQRLVARCRMTSNTFFELEMSSGATGYGALNGAGLTDSVSPWTWASGGSIKGSIQYQAAS